MEGRAWDARAKSCPVLINDRVGLHTEYADTCYPGYVLEDDVVCIKTPATTRVLVPTQQFGFSQ